MSTIQISYEENLEPLPVETEKRILSDLSILLEETENQTKTLSLFFCSSETMQELNQVHRNVIKPTDILSWAYDEEELSETTEVLLGELAICLEICGKQAGETGWDLEIELLRLLVHGIGHLMGFDHELSEADEKKMLEFEKGLLASINLKGVYD
jgi:rRNA maturation RNase YbeY